MRSASSRAYDRIGGAYRAARATDPRLAHAIWLALGDAETVVNVGAGTGSYEPRDRWMLAVEPSRVMIEQRPPGAAPVVEATAEALPLASRTVDAALAILTIHHWDDVETGLAELRRVARQRVVLVTMDIEALANFWLVRDYLPELLERRERIYPSMQRLGELLPGAKASVLPVRRDCKDGFMSAFWARPEAYLDPALRAATSPWQDLPADLVERALRALRADLDDGTWAQRNQELSALGELDVGLRLVAAPAGR